VSLLSILFVVVSFPIAVYSAVRSSIGDYLFTFLAISASPRPASHGSILLYFAKPISTSRSAA
jgi:hypothetical protein